MDARAAKIAISVALFLLLVPASAAAERVTARSADSFVDSIGVNTHTYYTDTVYYSRFDLVKQRLGELGVRHIRENLVTDRPDQYERLNELAAQGVRSTLIMGDPSEGIETLDELLAIARDEIRGSLAALEGPNEFDMRGGEGWAGELSAYQQHLYAAVKGDPALAALPVIGPSVVHHRNQEALGDISDRLDYGNVHSYPDGYSPGGNMNRHLGYAARNSGAEPVMATESGYHTALGWQGEHNPVSEEVQATYVPRMYLEYFRRGVARTFSYELLDEDAGSGDREDNFGLLRNDLSPKPAFTALRNMIAILADPGEPFAPGALEYSLSGDTEDVNHLLLQKRDGSFYLALWREADVWDPEAQAPLAAEGGTVTVEFDRRLGGAAVYAPNVSATPAAVPGGPISLAVGPQAVILRVVPGKPKAERIKLWVSRRAVPAGGRVGVRGKLPRYAAGRSLRVKIQQWRRGGWRTVGHSRTSRAGLFRKKIRMTKRSGRASRVRVVARVAKPSRAVRVRIRASRSQPPRRVLHMSAGRRAGMPAGRS